MVWVVCGDVPGGWYVVMCLVGGVWYGWWVVWVVCGDVWCGWCVVMCLVGGVGGVW